MLIVLFVLIKSRTNLTKTSCVRSTRASLARSDEVLVVTEEAEVVSQHSDDRNRLLVKDEFLADYTGITIELALPETPLPRKQALCTSCLSPALGLMEYIED
jgi:hypothetical protein